MCSMKTMLKIAVGIGVLLLVTYFAFPQFQPAIAAMGPWLLVLACPLGMMFMMGGHKNQEKEKTPDPAKPDPASK